MNEARIRSVEEGWIGCSLLLMVKDFEIPVHAIFDAEENLRVLRQLAAG